MNCGLILALELINTALELALDHLHPAQHPAIEAAKDCAAGAVLMLSITGIGVFTAFVVPELCPQAGCVSLLFHASPANPARQAFVVLMQRPNGYARKQLHY